MTIDKITVNVRKEWKAEKEMNNWTWKEIIGAGILAKKDNPQLIKRLTDVEMKVERLYEGIRKINEKIRDMKSLE